MINAALISYRKIFKNMFIYDHYDSYGGVRPPKIKYMGINDIFTEKASTVWYFHKGKWIKLQGSD